MSFKPLLRQTLTYFRTLLAENLISASGAFLFKAPTPFPFHLSRFRAHGMFKFLNSWFNRIISDTSYWNIMKIWQNPSSCPSFNKPWVGEEYHQLALASGKT